jgi:F-type H+-transporting ATPase subunit epsilon
MDLEIVTPEKTIFKETIDEITVTTADGEITVMPNHINLFTKVMPGEVTIKFSKKELFLAITGGFLEISNNKLTLLADYAVRAEEIEIEKAIEAQKRAEAVLKKAKDDVNERDFAEAQADLRRAILELHVAKRRRHNRNTPQQ